MPNYLLSGPQHILLRRFIFQFKTHQMVLNRQQFSLQYLLIHAFAITALLIKWQMPKNCDESAISHVQGFAGLPYDDSSDILCLRAPKKSGIKISVLHFR